MKRGRPSNKPRTEFGRRLYDARTAKGLSQAQVADVMNVTQASYGAWERVPVALRPEQLGKLTDLLDITVSYLFGEGACETTVVRVAKHDACSNRFRPSPDHNRNMCLL